MYKKVNVSSKINIGRAKGTYVIFHNSSWVIPISRLVKLVISNIVCASRKSGEVTNSADKVSPHLSRSTLLRRTDVILKLLIQ